MRDLNPQKGALTSVRLVNAAVFVAYVMVLYASYRGVESVLYAYQGMKWRPPPDWLLMCTGAVLATLAFLGPTSLRRPSALMYWMMLVTVTAPVLLFSYHGGSLSYYEVVPLTFLMAICHGFLILVTGRGRPVAPLRLRRFDFGSSSAVILALLVIGMFVVVSRQGFNWTLDLMGIYDRRLSARAAAPGGALASYVIATLNSAAAPLGVAIGLWERRWVLFSLSLVALVALFSFAGGKSALLTPVFLAALLTVGRGRVSSSPALMTLVALTIIALAWWIWSSTGNPLLSAGFTRRLIVGKGISMAHYFEAFRDYPVWFADSGIRYLVGGAPARAKASMIGEMYGFGSLENANASAWASMFGNIGYLGLPVATAAVAVLMRFFDRLSATGAPELVRAYSGYVIFVLGEIALESSVLNGGLLVGGTLLIWHVSSHRRPTAAI